MRLELLMPKLGLTMTEGTVSEWIVSPGSRFRTGDTLLMVESDKVAIEYPAECDGVLLECTVAAGETVEVGRVIGFIEAEGSSSTVAATAQSSDAPSAASNPAQTARADAPSTLSAPTAVGQPGAMPAISAQPAGSRIVATPLARRVAANLSVDLQKVSGSGPGGRIRAADVRSAVGQPEQGGGSPASVAAPAVAVPAPQETNSPTPKTQSSSSSGTLVKPTNVQATMARRLTASKQQIPHFYLAAEAEMSKLESLRASVNAGKPAVKLTLNHLIIAAIARSMRDLPEANQVWTDEGIQVFDKVDVGVAVSSDRGLLVPVVRDIGGASVSEIAARTTELVEKARQGSLKASDMGGGAITVSNAGMHEVTWMTPIINPGTSMILGIGSIRSTFRPDAEGKPELRREMGMVLAADHRLVDGVSGLTFLNRVISHLRDPLSLL